MRELAGRFATFGRVNAPNLADPTRRRAYRRELRNVARLLRWTGLALFLLGLAGLLLGRSGDWWIAPSWFSLIVGFLLVAAATVQRVRQRRKRASSLPEG